MNDFNEFDIRLAQYLLNYKDGMTAPPNNDPQTYKIEPHLFTDEQLLQEISEVSHKLKPFLRPRLTNFHAYSQNALVSHDPREEKCELLEHHQVYDKYILGLLKQFVSMTITLLVKLERMHKKHVLCGNVNPYTFMYFKKHHKCEPCDLGVLLSDKNVVNAETKVFGDYIYLLADLNSIAYNNYLAPELKHSVELYHLQRRLKLLVYEAEIRQLPMPNKEEIDHLLYDFHQKRIKYTNRAEIYSVGYSLNQILSHLLSKLAHLGLSMNEFPEQEVSKDIILEAELLLPDEFVNPEKERVIELLNECIVYIHDLMKEHMELRDTLEISIEKFVSLLKRISATTPLYIIEEGEAEKEEFEALLEEIEEFEAEELEEAEEEHEEEEEREEEEHEEHEKHEHTHEHAEHAEHAEHEEHAHGHDDEHEHEEREHIHEHGEHGHEEHEHEAHDHEHEEHEHEEHEHEEEEGEEEHEAHEEHHAEHEEHGYGEHGHAEHGEGHGHDEAHESHGSHDAHDSHSDGAHHEDPKSHPESKDNKPKRPAAH